MGPLNLRDAMNILERCRNSINVYISPFKWNLSNLKFHSRFKVVSSTNIMSIQCCWKGVPRLDAGPKWPGNGQRDGEFAPVTSSKSWEATLWFAEGSIHMCETDLVKHWYIGTWVHASTVKLQATNICEEKHVHNIVIKWNIIKKRRE